MSNDLDMQETIFLLYFPQFLEQLEGYMATLGFTKDEQLPAYHRRNGTIRASLFLTLKQGGKSLVVTPFFAVTDMELAKKCKLTEETAGPHLCCPLSVLIGNNAKQTPGGRRPGEFSWRINSETKVQLAAHEIFSAAQDHAVPLWNQFSSVEDLFAHFKTGKYVITNLLRFAGWSWSTPAALIPPSCHTWNTSKRKNARSSNTLLAICMPLG